MTKFRSRSIGKRMRAVYTHIDENGPTCRMELAKIIGESVRMLGKLSSHSVKAGYLVAVPGGKCGFLDITDAGREQLERDFEEVQDLLTADEINRLYGSARYNRIKYPESGVAMDRDVRA